MTDSIYNISRFFWWIYNRCRNERTLWDSIEMPYPETFDDDYKGRELTAGNTEMTMDYFSRQDMKMSPPKGLSKQKKRKWLHYGFKQNFAKSVKR